jgi:hypothetical protein
MHPTIRGRDTIHASGLYEDLTAMLDAFIDYLRRSDRRRR